MQPYISSQVPPRFFFFTYHFPSTHTRNNIELDLFFINMTSHNDQEEQTKSTSAVSLSTASRSPTLKNTEIGLPIRATEKKGDTSSALTQQQSAVSVSSPPFVDNVDGQPTSVRVDARSDFEPEYDFEFEHLPRTGQSGTLDGVDPLLRQKYNTAMSASPLPGDKERVTKRYSRIKGWNDEWKQGNKYCKYLFGIGCSLLTKNSVGG
jgi:hypothetical protein